MGDIFPDAATAIIMFLKWLKRKQVANTTARAAQESEDANLDPFNPFPDPVEIVITDVIDLHTIQPREVKAVVTEYLLQAHELRFPSVRIIHGKGIGVQRDIVRKVLALTPFVEDWTDAPPDGGGLGATIVHFHRCAGVLACRTSRNSN